MSWSLKRTPHNQHLLNELSNAVNAVASKSILFAATGDGLESSKGSYPACFDNVISVCSTNIVGTPSAYAEYSNSNFWVAGEALKVDLRRYFDLNGAASISGSSGSTALAAGLASLILTCVRFSCYPDNRTETEATKNRATKEVEKVYKTFKTTQHMRNVFRNMCVRENPSFVCPWEKFENITDEMSLDEIKQSLQKLLQELEQW